LNKAKNAIRKISSQSLLFFSFIVYMSILDDLSIPNSNIFYFFRNFLFFRLYMQIVEIIDRLLYNSLANTVYETTVRKTLLICRKMQIRL